jgi:hypothetical protein
MCWNVVIPQGDCHDRLSCWTRVFDWRLPGEPTRKWCLLRQERGGRYCFLTRFWLCSFLCEILHLCPILSAKYRKLVRILIWCFVVYYPLENNLTGITSPPFFLLPPFFWRVPFQTSQIRLCLPAISSPEFTDFNEFLQKKNVTSFSP